MDLNRKIGAGVLWTLANLFMSRGASVVFTLFLARFLAPEALGLIAMTTVVFQLATGLVESGLGQALIRSKSVSQQDLSTVFFSNIGLSVVAYAALFLAAPYVADFYRQAPLTSVVRVAGCVVLLNAFRVVQVAALRRALNFRVEMKVDAISVVLSGVAAVVLAYFGAGVWSLVAQMLIGAAVSSGILWFSGDWRPSPMFSGDSFKRLFGFGSNLALESMLESLYQNSSVLVIGRAFSAELTGLYFFATRISNLLSQQLTSAVQRATFPALAIIQDDSFLLRLKYRQIIQMMMFLIAPLMFMLAAIASPLFKLFFSSRWGGAVLYVELLTPVGVLYPLHAMNLNVLSVKGRSDLILKLGFVKKSVNVALLLAAIPFGVAGIVVSQAIGSLLALIPNTYYTERLIDYGLKDQITDVSKPILAALVAAIAANRSMLLVVGSVPAQLGVALVTGGASYLLASFLLRSEGMRLALRKLPRSRVSAASTGSHLEAGDVPGWPRTPPAPPRAEHEITSRWQGDCSLPTVSILCHAFNHAPYLRDALNGLLMQETSFAFEIVLHDDASTDGTADIVRDYQARYPQLIRAVLQRENQYSKGTDPALTTIPLARGNWIAVCEGDDYWIDPQKLARQIEALERHAECKLCFHPAYRVECATGTSVTIGVYSNRDEAVIPVADMILKARGTIPTAALLLRRDVALEFCAFREARPYLTVGDLYLHILGSLDAGALYVGAVMSVYRMLTPGSWSEGYEKDLQFQLRHTESRLRSFDELDVLTGRRFSHAFRKANTQFVGATLKNPRLDRTTRMRFLSRHAPRLPFADRLLFFVVTYVPGALSIARAGHRYVRARRN